MPAFLTPKDFVQLARAVQLQLGALGVSVPKGHYCHILEATARGLGFSSKSALDVAQKRSGKAVAIPDRPNEDAARQWLIRTGLPKPIPDSFLAVPFATLFPTTPTTIRIPAMAKSKTPVPPASPKLNPLAQATSNIVAQYGNRVWSTADTLRGVGAKASEWPNHMMPFFALMLLESRALRARTEALDTFNGQFDPTDAQDVADLKAAYVSAGGAASQTYHEDLIIHGQGLAHVVSGGPAGFSQRLRTYLNGYDDITRRWLGVNPSAAGKAYLNIEGTVRFLEGKGGEHLWHYCQAWAQVDLTGYDSSAVTTLEEHIKRRWADISADTAGEHYTPADLIELISAIAVDHFKRHPLKGKFLRIYDPTCGGGNMLFGVEDDLRAADEAGELLNADGERYSIQSFGQELNDTLFSLAAIEGRFRPAATIKEGNTLSDDQFAGEKFHLIIANPPYGTDWKPLLNEINNDQTGRFPSGCRPPVSDGQHLFLQHIYHHLADDGLALVFCSGSTLFSGDAGGGESNARSKYILTDDGVWGLIQLPKNEFFNTGINTYVWVFKKCKPDSMSRRMFLLNAETLFTKMRKSLGNKNSEITAYDRQKIVSLIGAAEDPATAMALMEEGAALTVDIANRMKPATVSGWVNPDGAAVSEIDDVGRFQADLARMNEVHPKVIQLKQATQEEPALLRLFDGEQLHYNKVAIELTRQGANGALSDSFVIKDAKFDFGLGASERETEGGPATADSVKKTQQWINDNLAAGVPIRFVGEKGEAYEWNSTDRELTRDGVALGRGKVSIKTKHKKGTRGESDREIIEITAGPDTEKDTETTPYSRDNKTNQNLINAFLTRWVRDPYEIIGEPDLGCEINFNRLFPKTAERKTLAQVNQELADLDAQIAAMHKEGA